MGVARSHYCESLAAFMQCLAQRSAIQWRTSDARCAEARCATMSAPELRDRCDGNEVS